MKRPDSSSDPSIRDSIDAMHSGEVDPEQSEARHYLEAHKEQKQFFEDIQAKFYVEPVMTVEQGLRDVLTRIGKQDYRVDLPPVETRVLRLRRSVRATLLGAALIGGALLGVGAGQWVAKMGSPSGVSGTVQLVAAAGQLATVPLPDGSTITVAPLSTIEYSGDFAKNRVIDINGEGYLEVASSTSAPFTVRTRQTEVRVLGTAFAVRQYAQDTVTRVVVTSGRVALLSISSVGVNERPVVLGVGDVAQMGLNGEVLNVSGLSAQDALSWTNERIRMNNIPLSEIIPELERLYNIRITVRDQQLEKVTLSVEATRRQLDETIRALSISLGTDVRRVGNNVYIGSPVKNGEE